jgi:hypothetical protein
VSGGHFEYAQHHIGDIYREIESVIDLNDDKRLDEYGCPIGYSFMTETIKQFVTAVAFLKIAEVYAQRIDWLLSGDDGEDTFHKRLDKDLEALGGQ